MGFAAAEEKELGLIRRGAYGSGKDGVDSLQWGLLDLKGDRCRLKTQSELSYKAPLLLPDICPGASISYCSSSPIEQSVGLPN